MPASRANPGFGVGLYQGDGGVGAGVQASKTIGTSNQQVIFKNLLAGTAGNSKTVAIVISGNNTAFSKTVTATQITINGATDAGGLSTTTVNELLYQLMQDSVFIANWQATRGAGNGTGVIVASASSSLTGGTNGAEVFTLLAEITDLPGFGTSHRTDEVTHMSSPNGWAENIGLGVKEGKAFTVALNFVADDPAQVALFQTKVESGTTNNYRIRFTDKAFSGVTFGAIVNDTDISHPRDAKADLSVQFLPSGPYTWATGLPA